MIPTTGCGGSPLHHRACPAGRSSHPSPPPGPKQVGPAERRGSPARCLGCHGENRDPRQSRRKEHRPSERVGPVVGGRQARRNAEPRVPGGGGAPWWRAALCAASPLPGRGEAPRVPARPTGASGAGVRRSAACGCVGLLPPTGQPYRSHVHGRSSGAGSGRSSAGFASRPSPWADDGRTARLVTVAARCAPREPAGADELALPWCSSRARTADESGRSGAGSRAHEAGSRPPAGGGRFRPPSGRVSPTAPRLGYPPGRSCCAPTIRAARTPRPVA
jgi:hypothetical protein